MSAIYNKVYGRNAMWISSDKESLMCWKQQIILKRNNFIIINNIYYGNKSFGDSVYKQLLEIKRK